MEVEVEVAINLLQSEDPRPGQVYSAAPLPHLYAEVHDYHHEGGIVVPCAHTHNPGGVGVLLDAVRLDDDVVIVLSKQNLWQFFCHLTIA